jgi:solute carrier family 36 (proton-coupled amino acid transporter)
VPPDPAFEHIHEPGGFRRNYVLLQATIGEDGEQQQPRILNNFIDFLYLFGHFVSLQLSSLSFSRYRYVYQAGEDLEEIEEEDEETADEEDQLYGQPSGSREPSASQTRPEVARGSLTRILAEAPPSKSTVSETSPLLPRASSVSRSRTRRRRSTVSHGDATVGQAVLMVCHVLPVHYTDPRAHFENFT